MYLLSCTLILLFRFLDGQGKYLYSQLLQIYLTGKLILDERVSIILLISAKPDEFFITVNVLQFLSPLQCHNVLTATL